MQTDELDNNSPWMTEEIKDKIRHRDKIVKEQDIESLFQLFDNDDFSIALYEILSNKCGYNPDILNPNLKTIFLCMLMENAGQADHILSFLQEDFSKYADEVINALNEIGATKSSEIIKQAVQLLPEDGSWFFDTASESLKNLMSKLDSDFSSYPDGQMRDLYRKFADKHRGDF